MMRSPRPHPMLPVAPAVIRNVEMAGLLSLADLAAGRPADELIAQALVSRELARAGIGDDAVVDQAEQALEVLAGDDAGGEIPHLTTMLSNLLAQLRLCNRRQLDRAQDAALEALATSPSPAPR